MQNQKVENSLALDPTVETETTCIGPKLIRGYTEKSFICVEESQGGLKVGPQEESFL